MRSRGIFGLLLKAEDSSTSFACASLRRTPLGMTFLNLLTFSRRTDDQFGSQLSLDLRGSIPPERSAVSRSRAASCRLSFVFCARYVLLSQILYTCSIFVMLHYVIEKNVNIGRADPKLDGADALWTVLELPSRKEAGTLRRTGEVYIAESEKHRNTSEAANALLVLRMAFRSEHFFIQHDGELQKLTEQDLK